MYTGPIKTVAFKSARLPSETLAARHPLYTSRYALTCREGLALRYTPFERFAVWRLVRLTVDTALTTRRRRHCAIVRSRVSVAWYCWSVGVLSTLVLSLLSLSFNVFLTPDSIMRMCIYILFCRRFYLPFCVYACVYARRAPFNYSISHAPALYARNPRFLCNIRACVAACVVMAWDGRVGASGLIIIEEGKV